MAPSRMRIALLLVLAASLGACKVHRSKRGFRIGTGCEKMDESCASGSTANVCRDDALATVSCKGPKGCVDAPPDDVACDQTIAAENDPCAGDDYACTADKAELLECESGKFATSAKCSSHVCVITVARLPGATMTTHRCE